MKLKLFTIIICLLSLIIFNGALPHLFGMSIIKGLAYSIWCCISGYYYGKFLFWNFKP